MPYVTCSLCGNSGIQKIDIDICYRCIVTKGDGVKILAIKKYLEKYPGSTIIDLVKNLGIRQKDVDRFVEDGSLKLIYDSNGIIITDEKPKEIEKSKEHRKNISELQKLYNTAKKREDEKSKLVSDLEEKRREREIER